MSQFNSRKKGRRYHDGNDVFMSRDGVRRQDNNGRAGSLRYRSGREDNQSGRSQELRQEEIDGGIEDIDADEFEEYDEAGNRGSTSDFRSQDRNYFSRGSNIINEKMVRYQKRQLPPLHRYDNDPRSIYPDQNSQLYWDDNRPEYSRRRSRQAPTLSGIWQKFIVTFASILSLVCVTWIAYNWNSNKRSGQVNGREQIIIEPEHPSFKVLPENLGGIDVSHKDKTVYERVDQGQSSLNLGEEEKLLPPQEVPVNLPVQNGNTQSTNRDIEEYSIVDEKTYYIKISAGKSKAVLENEAKLLKKRYSTLLSELLCSVKKVSNSQGEQKHAILVGPFVSQSSALEVAKNLGDQCYIVAVRE